MTSELPPWLPGEYGADRAGFDVDLLFIEKADVSDPGRWMLAGALAKVDGEVIWVGAPLDEGTAVEPALAFEYWIEKGGGNGYSIAVFHHRVRSVADAQVLVARRHAELAHGAQSITKAPTHDLVDLPGGAGALLSSREPSRGVDERLTDMPDDLVGFQQKLQRTRPMSQALVWRLASELVRRHPERLWVISQGSGGMYDRVTVVDLRSDGKHVVTLNAAGANCSLAHVDALDWTAAYAEGMDSADWVRHLERLCGLRPPGSALPASTPASLSVRWVAAFMTLQVTARHRWFVASGTRWFADPVRTGMEGPDTWVGLSADRARLLVYVGRVDESAPRFVLSPDGDLWDCLHEQHHELPVLHRPGRPVTALLLATVPDLCP